MKSLKLEKDLLEKVEELEGSFTDKVIKGLYLLLKEEKMKISDAVLKKINSISWEIENDEEYMFCIGLFVKDVNKSRQKKDAIILKEIFPASIEEKREYNKTLQENLIKFYTKYTHYISTENRVLSKIIANLMEYTPSNSVENLENFLIAGFGE